MRGEPVHTEGMISSLTPAHRVPTDHTPRPLRAPVDEVLIDPSPVFPRMYARIRRPSVSPERIIRGLLLVMPYSIRSER